MLLISKYINMQYLRPFNTINQEANKEQHNKRVRLF